MWARECQKLRRIYRAERLNVRKFDSRKRALGMRAKMTVNRTGFPGGPDIWKDKVHGDKETDAAVPGGAARSRRLAGARAGKRR